MATNKKELRDALVKSLNSFDTMNHILPVHFVSEEAAEYRRFLDDRPSSTFHANKYTWEAVRKAVETWLKSDTLSAAFLDNILRMEGTMENIGHAIGPLKESIGVLFPLYGNKEQCHYIGIIVQAFRNEGGIAVRIKSIYPVPRADYFKRSQR